MEEELFDKYINKFMFKNYPDIVSVEQMSNMLNISTKTAYRLLHENKIKYFMIGRIYKIPKINILNYLYTILQYTL
ncbi:helix-turn-helix domain-containing protein [Clostridium cadaveris]|uniref:DNA binding domain-containing protein, excisionase family n=1 Tax=Clostridium cadaveris TaxID=1529 RepID=A0A1I2JRT2_9CLOT|nr:helix-turn-helix domain-containing protein [Clostridium cadaveris]SFF57492.1 DNA binding domain-containing protein, excisionase family [Clostridium cadaveris]